MVVVKTITQTLSDKGETYLPAMDWSFKDEANCTSLFQKICKSFAFTARRDFYAFALMLMSFMGVTALKVSTVGSVVIIGFVFGQHIKTKLLKKATQEALPLPQVATVYPQATKVRPESTTGQVPILS
jgi:hypothetical protein